ncbi:MAG: DEAD/DEAH box helicase [Labilithrix sp.]|nr:DEAD/DEAH box helicase [Labilithrix sp.]
MTEYASWFERVAGFAPHPWQRRIGEAPSPQSRLLRIPTGLGKSAGTVLPWLHHAVHRADPTWPRRLAFVLPMRVLADQVAREARQWIDAAKLDVPVHLLMGGAKALRWVEDLDRAAVLVGTQDMLLSRALNRGYGSGRGLWPMEFGALHSDTLWIFDEVQLMGVGLATSTQLEAFRRSRSDAVRPAYSWWMSATLQPDWLDSIDFRDARQRELAEPTRVPAEERSGGIWDNEKKLGWRRDVTTEDEIARTALDAHRPESQTLIVVNTVRRALDTLKALEKATKKSSAAPELHLAHSRFRPYERAAWSFLDKDAERALPPAGRIIVATQVVEAGVDISSALLVTDLAPYPSLVQRFGRAARRPDSSAQVIVVGDVPTDEKRCAPYTPVELGAAAMALERLVTEGSGASIRELESAEGRWETDFLRRVYPYVPEQILRRAEFDDLFDTTPDLSGADLDVGRYIRVGDDRDVRVFWRPLESTPRALTDIDPPRREELCAVPLRELDDWRIKNKVPVYVLDYETGTWRSADRLIPGASVLIPASAGGYAAEVGWDPSSKVPVLPVPVAEDSAEIALVESSASAESDALSELQWKTIAFHGREVADEVTSLAQALRLSPALASLLALAGRWHDTGKAHEVFASAILADRRPPEIALAQRRDLAKAPPEAWRRRPTYTRRGFRHELASTLALFECLKRTAPDHPAVRGFSWQETQPLSSAAEHDAPHGQQSPPTTSDVLGPELAALTADEFDLVAYLVCTHHGKIRCTWASQPLDQAGELPTVDQASQPPNTFGVRHGDPLPEIELATRDGGYAILPALELSLEPAEMGLGERYGRSWTDRVARLRSTYGPFTLAYLEALLRSADWSASRRETPEDR